MKCYDASSLNNILECIKNNPSEKYESEYVEFKNYRNPKAMFAASSEISKELIAFANKFGGCVVIGVVDSNDVKAKNWPAQLDGIDYVDELEIAKRISGKLKPAVELRVTNHNFEDKNYIVIEIDHRADTLVTSSKSAYYIRDGRDSRPMEGQEVIDAVKSLRRYDWSQDIIDVPNIYSCIDLELLESAIDEYTDVREFSRRPSHETFLESIGVTINGSLTKGGLLFLGTKEAIQKNIGRLEYRISKRVSGGHLPVNEIWSGSLWESVIKSRTLFDKIVEYKSFKDAGKDFTFPTIDKTAFEEAFINALVHRDYTEDGMITVDFSDQQVVVSSPGTFVGGISVQNIFHHQPRHRNKALSAIFMSLNLMDRAGMGTRRMTINSLKYGRKKPIFSDQNSSIQVVLETNSINEDIFRRTSPYDNYDVSELLIISGLSKSTTVSAGIIYEEIKEFSSTPRTDFCRAIDKLKDLSLVGNESGIELQIKSEPSFWQKFNLFSSRNNELDLYSKIFMHLMRNESSTLKELSKVMSFKSKKEAQKTLSAIKFVKTKSTPDLTTYCLA
jgi:predicted HTH transcriptional regulator